MNNSLSNKITTKSPAEADDTHLSYHITRVRVPLFEVDPGQAVYHANYFHLFELGREAFLRHIGFPYRQFMNRQLHLIKNFQVSLYLLRKIDKFHRRCVRAAASAPYCGV